MKKLLVPVNINSHDENKNVASYVSSNIDLTDACFYFLYVIPPTQYSTALSASYIFDRSVSDELKTIIKNKVEDVSNDYNVMGEKKFIYIDCGIARYKILDWANLLQVDLIIMSKGKSCIKNYLFGSTAVTVSRKSKCPTLIIC